ncbi:MAG: hypothetical protein FJ267_15370 [Planctomycetes bacterium]|nr:hypothetical protein [Planctomycetota bacterium]
MAITQDRVHSTSNSLNESNGIITLTQVATGQGLFAPLIVDWNPARFRVEAIWRNLTVTENGQVVPPDFGAGHRLQQKDFQLILYRNLKSRSGSRAFLGHHTYSETVIGRLDKKGFVRPIVHVESE